MTFSHMLRQKPTFFPSVLPSAGILECAASRGKSEDALLPECPDLDVCPHRRGPVAWPLQEMDEEQAAG